MLLGYRSDDSIEHLPDEHEFVTGVCTLAACIFVDLCTCVTMYICGISYKVMASRDFIKKFSPAVVQ